LGNVVLMLKSLGGHDLIHFHFLDAPSTGDTLDRAGAAVRTWSTQIQVRVLGGDRHDSLIALSVNPAVFLRSADGHGNPRGLGTQRRLEFGRRPSLTHECVQQMEGDRDFNGE
ncbi:hypothetical protein PENTCL1PPCAC_24827, partial [Pristionchus entomophagus]